MIGLGEGSQKRKVREQVVGSVWLQASWSHGILNCLCPGLWAVFSLVGMMVYGFVPIGLCEVFVDWKLNGSGVRLWVHPKRTSSLLLCSLCSSCGCEGLVLKLLMPRVDEGQNVWCRLVVYRSGLGIPGGSLWFGPLTWSLSMLGCYARFVFEWIPWGPLGG